MTALHKHHTFEDLLDHFENYEESSHSFYSIGMSNAELEQLIKLDGCLYERPMPINICIDVANGYMKSFGEFCRTVRERFPHSIIMAGNVVSYNGAANLINHGVTFPKVGIGSGAVCLTRTQTGIGYPQFSAVLETANQALPNMNRYSAVRQRAICSDGGCVTPGDVAKAFGAGATLVMLGTMLSGTDEGGGEIVEIDGKKFVQFYGMSSKTAQNRHNGGLREYRSSEGRTILTPYKGSVNDVIRNILGGVRSTCTYVGARSIDKLNELSKFVRVNSVINRSMESHTVGN